MAIGKVRSRNGDIIAFGNVTDFGPKKLYRFTKSSLSPDVVALIDGIDIGVFTRVVAIELSTGSFLRDLVGAQFVFCLIPFWFFAL